MVGLIEPQLVHLQLVQRRQGHGSGNPIVRHDQSIVTGPLQQAIANPGCSPGTAGNFVEATSDTPYFQIGEHKYGKPILDRVVTIDTPLEQVVKAVCVSMDSTLHSNLSVGMPLDLAVLRRDRFAFQVRERIEADDPRFQNISREWGGRLREAFLAMPDVVSIG